jgi:hypothetical protein
MVKLLMRELPRNSPALPEIEVDGPSIGLNHSKSGYYCLAARAFSLPTAATPLILVFVKGQLGSGRPSRMRWTFTAYVFFIAIPMLQLRLQSSAAGLNVFP